MPERDAPVVLEDVTFAYDRRPVIENASLTIRAGDYACIIGPNAGGKSTLLKLMLGLLAPRRGTVELFGRPPREARQRVGYLPQYLHFDQQFPISNRDVVLLGRLGNDHAYGPYRRRAKEIADQALREVDLYDVRDRLFSDLSGGQRQRVLIARALACEPDLLMLDEPTSNLDVNVEQELYDLLLRLNRRLTVVVVSHDVAYVSKAVKTAICVNRTVHTHSTDELNGEVIGRLYGREVRLLHTDAGGDKHAANLGQACQHDHEQDQP